jgi:hypothetical protein
MSMAAKEIKAVSEGLPKQEECKYLSSLWLASENKITEQYVNPLTTVDRIF